MRHADFPHEPGRLYGCGACEAACHCAPGASECVFSGDHATFTIGAPEPPLADQSRVNASVARYFVTGEAIGCGAASALALKWSDAGAGGEVLWQLAAGRYVDANALLEDIDESMRALRNGGAGLSERADDELHALRGWIVANAERHEAD